MLMAVPAAPGEAKLVCAEAVSTTRPIDRVAGPDRYATAACASQAAYPATTGGSVVLARGDDAGGFADALAGTVLARAIGGPVLLTSPTVLPPPTEAELVRLTPARSSR